jgi:hypothetical protein
MRFKGQLLLPGESGPGLKVNLDVAEHHLAVESDGGGLGAWPLEVVDVERLHGEVFGLTVAGEALRFVADDTIAFAYSAVPAIEQVAGRSRNRSGVRSMIGRLWKGPDRPDEPAAVETLPIDEPRPVEEPPAAEQILEIEAADSWAQPQVQTEATIYEPVHEEPIQAPRSPAPKPTAAGEAAPGATQCPAVRSDGRRCESQILTDSGYCYPHDPRRAFEDGYQAAQEARAQLKRDATARLNRIYGRLDKAMRQVERGELDPDTAMAMAQLARTMCAILEMDEPTTDED